MAEDSQGMRIERTEPRFVKEHGQELEGSGFAS